MVWSVDRMYMFLLTCSISNLPLLDGFIEIEKIIMTLWQSLIEHTQSPAYRMVRLAATWMDFMHSTFVNVYSVCTYTVLCSAFSGRLGFLAFLPLHILCSLYWRSALVIRLSHFLMQAPLK